MVISRKIFFMLFLTMSYHTVFSQEKNLTDVTIYEAFQLFFNNEIKYQGVKGDWIFGLNEITAYHKFDYDNDGVNNMLIEFNAAPVDEGNYTNYYAVLFKNENNQSYHFIDFVEATDLQFLEAENQLIVFENTKNSKKVIYTLIDSKFVEYTK
ncbi:hypothetical protein SAMN06265371_103336 [Lutibacter agarilyticus]|uniref:Uncharacterized protein n=2 Tax=Lutibacter agarilyticus TaxID=1109740 RepID=A0A238WL00_9FLAO|nr:hypothetical protein SAMN06265371_103336 [Lutibacter agarilyticus]